MSTVIALPQLRITPQLDNQIDEAAALLHTLWHACYDRQLPASVTRQRSTAHFRQHLARHAGRCWLAWLGERLVGIVTTGANCIDDVWVARRFRRRGIATRLIATACDDIKRRDYRFAQAGCEDFNLAANGLFTALDWQQIGAEPVQLTPGKRCGALVYSRPLDSGPEHALSGGERGEQPHAAT